MGNRSRCDRREMFHETGSYLGKIDSNTTICTDIDWYTGVHADCGGGAIYHVHVLGNCNTRESGVG